MELRRADIGFGKIVIDDNGVVRRGLLRTRGLTWDAIDEYRLTIRGGAAAYDPWKYGNTDIGEVRKFIDDVRGKNRVYWLGLELSGGGTTVKLNWRFREIERAIAEILSRTHDRLLGRAQASKPARFGPLVIGADEIVYKGDRLARSAVDRIELFDSIPVSLRVLERDKVRPFAKADLDDVPNALIALQLAKELGYRTAGSKLLDEALATADRHVIYRYL